MINHFWPYYLRSYFLRFHLRYVAFTLRYNVKIIYSVWMNLENTIFLVFFLANQSTLWMSTPTVYDAIKIEKWFWSFIKLQHFGHTHLNRKRSQTYLKYKESFFFTLNFHCHLRICRWIWNKTFMVRSIPSTLRPRGQKLHPI